MIESRYVLVALAVLAGLALASVAMGAMHGEHYRSRREELLEARIAALEKIVTGRHRR